MKHLVAVTALGIATLAAPLARSQTTAIMGARIPFSFVIGEQRLPAGDYQVSLDAAMGTVRLLSKQSGEEVMALSTARETRTREDHSGRLTFHRYGADHFLRAIWFPGRTEGRALSRSKAEQELARRLGPAQKVEVTPPAH
jgi:hypothetical protein